MNRRAVWCDEKNRLLRKSNMIKIGSCVVTIKNINKHMSIACLFVILDVQRQIKDSTMIKPLTLVLEQICLMIQ